jgi:hypothetical protein
MVRNEEFIFFCRTLVLSDVVGLSFEIINIIVEYWRDERNDSIEQQISQIRLLQRLFHRTLSVLHLHFYYEKLFLPFMQLETRRFDLRRRRLISFAKPGSADRKKALSLISSSPSSLPLSSLSPSPLLLSLKKTTCIIQDLPSLCRALEVQNWISILFEQTRPTAKSIFIYEYHHDTACKPKKESVNGIARVVAEFTTRTPFVGQEIHLLHVSKYYLWEYPLDFKLHHFIVMNDMRDAPTFVSKAFLLKNSQDKFSSTLHTDSSPPSSSSSLSSHLPVSAHSDIVDFTKFQCHFQMNGFISMIVLNSDTKNLSVTFSYMGKGNAEEEKTKSVQIAKFVSFVPSSSSSSSSSQISTAVHQKIPSTLKNLMKSWEKDEQYLYDDNDDDGDNCSDNSRVNLECKEQEVRPSMRVEVLQKRNRLSFSGPLKPSWNFDEFLLKEQREFEDKRSEKTKKMKMSCHDAKVQLESSREYYDYDENELINYDAATATDANDVASCDGGCGGQNRRENSIVSNYVTSDKIIGRNLASLHTELSNQIEHVIFGPCFRLEIPQSNACFDGKSTYRANNLFLFALLNGQTLTILDRNAFENVSTFLRSRSLTPQSAALPLQTELFMLFRKPLSTVHSTEAHHAVADTTTDDDQILSLNRDTCYITRETQSRFRQDEHSSYITRAARSACRHFRQDEHSSYICDDGNVAADGNSKTGDVEACDDVFIPILSSEKLQMCDSTFMSAHYLSNALFPTHCRQTACLFCVGHVCYLKCSTVSATRWKSAIDNQLP